MSHSIHLRNTDYGVRVEAVSHTDDADNLWATIKIVPLNANGFGVWDYVTTLFLDEKTIRSLRKQLKQVIAEFDNPTETE